MDESVDIEVVSYMGNSNMTPVGVNVAGRGGLKWISIRNDL